MTTKTKIPVWRRLLTNRRTVQVSALLLSNASVLSVLRFIPCGYLQCSNCSISTFSCPLILIERGMVMASMGMIGGLGSKFTDSMAGAMAMLILFGAIFGAFGCGWLCPFGFLQDMLAKIPARKWTMPEWSGHLRVPIFLGIVVAVPYLTGRMLFCDLCPPGAINRLWQQAAGIPMFFKAPEGILAVSSLGLLSMVLLTAVFVHRPFCFLLCPIGGIYGLFNKISGIFIKVDTDRCVACNRCADNCPQGINPLLEPAHSQCIRCLECTDSCRFATVDIR